MKTFKNTIRTTAVAGLFSMASLLSFSQQDSKVWLTIESSNNVPVENASGALVSNDASFNEAISSLNITNSLKLRFIPSLSFQERMVNYSYNMPNIIDTVFTQQQRVESTFLDFPFNFKFRTYRAHNFAASFIVGGKYSLDMASQQDVTEDAILKIKKPDYSFELGVGTDFFLQYFKFGLELKYSMGFPNALIQENNQWSRPIDSLKNQMWLFSITFEG